MPTFNLTLNSLPLPGLSASEAKEYGSWLSKNSTAGGRALAANETMDQIFSESAVAKMALAKLAPQLTEQLKSKTPTKEAIGMLSMMLANTQTDMYTSLFQDNDPDWQAQTDASQRAQDTLNDYRMQYGWIR